MSLRGWTRGILRALRVQGWRVEHTCGQHIKATPPDRAKPIVVQSSTPSDHRSVRNWIAQLRRSGFTW